MSASPTAAEVVADPSKAADVDPATLTTILAQLTTASAVVAARLSALPASTGSDKCLTVAEAAAMTGMSETWLARSEAAKTLRVKLGTDTRYSLLAIQRYIARNRGR